MVEFATDLDLLQTKIEASFERSLKAPNPHPMYTLKRYFFWFITSFRVIIHFSACFNQMATKQETTVAYVDTEYKDFITENLMIINQIISVRADTGPTL